MPTNKFVPVRSLLIAVGCLTAFSASPLGGEVPAASPVSTPIAGPQALPETPDSSPSPTPAAEVTPTPTPTKLTPTSEPGDPTLNTSDSFWLDNYPLNDLL